MYGIDSVNHQVRPNLIYVEGGGSAFRIAPEQGKALNLREGQIINGTIALRPEGNAIKISGQYLSLPAGLGVPGSRVELQVSILAGAYVLRKMGLGSKGDGQVGSSRGPLVDFHNSRFERLLRLDQSKGILRFPLDSLLSNLFGDVELAKKLAEADFQMNTHAIGDSTIKILIDAYNDVLIDKEDPRWRIEHSQIVDLSDLSGYNSKILPSVQPTHATSDMYWAEDRIGNKRIKGAYPYKMLLEKSGVI